MNKVVLQSVTVLVALASAALGTGCTHINLHQLAYEVLRQEDCRINQLDDFCNRTFAKEYREYVRLRRDFMRSQQQTDWRLSQNDTKIASTSLP